MSRGLLIGAALLSVVAVNRSVAQTDTAAPPPNPPAASTPAPTAAPAAQPEAARNGPTDNQIADEVDARIAKLKADLRLTSDQDSNWSGLQTTLHDYGVNQMKRRLDIMNARETRRDARREESRDKADRGKNDNQPNAMTQMRKDADALSAHAADLKKLADAAEPLYRGLDSSQRRELIRFIRMGFERGMR